MRNNPYIPQPGTIAARVVDWLRQQAPGQWFATAVVSDALGINQGGWTSGLNMAINEGLVLTKKDKGLLYWANGSGVRLPPSIFPDNDGPLDPVLHVNQRIVPAAAAVPIAPIEAAKADPKPAATPPPADRIPRYAIWSDGQFSLQKGGQAIALSRDETRALLAYLERMAVEETS